MANFCYECTDNILGVDPTWNDFAGGIPENEMWQVLCEGCGMIVVDNDGKRVNETHLSFCERIDADPEH